MWRDGKLVKVLDVHKDCVRGLCRLPQGGFASCANDAYVPCVQIFYRLTSSFITEQYAFGPVMAISCMNSMDILTLSIRLQLYPMETLYHLARIGL